MNKTRIQDAIRSRFGNADEIQPSVFKARYSHKDRLVGIYYFDCSDVLKSPNFDLNEYQNKFIADDYYKQPSAIQWNYYLYFVCDETAYTDALHSGRFANIENNRDFARKHLTTEKLLNEEFERGAKANTRSPQGLPEDVAGRWMETLRRHKLDGVYMPDIPMAKVVRDYLAGRPILETASPQKTKAPVDGVDLPFIKILHKKKFRRFPIGGPFDFGKVTLIQGPNGCGKTSLLEAIEFWICGQTFRNIDSPEQDVEIGLQLEGNKNVEWYESHGNEFYRQRALRWYGDPQVKGNHLCKGFNRFNFYDSDAAFRVSSQQKDISIQEAMAGLVFGETANIIQKRIESIRDLFEPEAKSYRSNLILLNNELRASKDELKDLDQKVEQSLKSWDIFLSDLKAVSWKSKPPNNEESDLNKFINIVAEITSQIESCDFKTSWLEDRSWRNIEDLSSKLNDSLEALRKLNENIKKAQTDSRKNAEEMQTLEYAAKNLQRLGQYAADEEAQQLLGLDNLIESKLKDEQRFQSVVEQIDQLDLETHLQHGESVAVLERREESTIKDLEIKIKNEKKRLAILQKERGIVEGLTQEIRSKAKELLSHRQELTQCPVCQTVYEVGELAKRLSTKGQTLSDSNLDNSVRMISDLEKTLKTANNRLSEIRRIKSAAEFFFDESDSSKRSLGQLAKLLSGVPETQKQTVKQLGDLRKLKARLANRGLKESELTNLVDWLKEEFRDVKYGYENKAALGNLFSKNVKTLQEVKGKTRLTNEQLREYLKQKEKIISSLSSYSIPVEDLESQLMSRNNELKETSAAFKDVSRYLALPQNEQIPHVVIRLKQIQAAYGRFQEAQKVSSESKRRRKGLTDKIESTQNKITLAKGKKELAETAIEALNDILNNESKEKHLQTFLHQNKIEITEIFKDIHSPREFSDLDFQSSPIHLVRESNKHHDPISKISSGQRAALALSIFLTLNQKLIHGPPYLFFDDPVAFVDDLNTLSFLDFLREIAISGSRQIFFATASQKIASLFAKKFEFLAGDFKQHTLAR